VCRDLNAGAPFAEPVELVYAALILEFLDVTAFLEYAASLLREDGRIAFVFQEHHAQQGAVTDSGVTSLQVLKDAHAIVDVALVMNSLMARGMTLEERRSMATTAGKSFTLLIVKKMRQS